MRCSNSGMLAEMRRCKKTAIFPVEVCPTEENQPRITRITRINYRILQCSGLNPCNPRHPRLVFPQQTLHLR
jgi:hypothetical protein